MTGKEEKIRDHHPGNEDGDFVAYALVTAEDLEIEEPKTYAEAMRNRERKHWDNAVKEEMESHRKNMTWDQWRRQRNC